MAILQLTKVQTVRKELTAYFPKFCHTFGSDEIIYELMGYRNYQTQDMFDTLKELGVCKLSSLFEFGLHFPEVTPEQLTLWGLTNKDGTFLLKDRYTVPIRDIAGNVIALVGWDPRGGPRKYVTTPTYGFSRDCSFFNYDHAYEVAWTNFQGKVIEVEGIFDAVSLRSIGLPAIANQGLEMSKLKGEMLRRFSKVIAIPDNDKGGRSVNPVKNESSGKSAKFIWEISSDFVFVDLPKGIKDVDEFVREYDCYDDFVESMESHILKRLHVETS